MRSLFSVFTHRYSSRTVTTSRPFHATQIFPSKGHQCSGYWRSSEDLPIGVKFNLNREKPVKTPALDPRQMVERDKGSEEGEKTSIFRPQSTD